MSEKTTIFIDTQDMEERYGEELYKEYLEKEIKRLKEVIEEVRKYIESNPLVVVSEYDYYVNDVIHLENCSVGMSFIGTILQILDKVGDSND